MYKGFTVIFFTFLFCFNTAAANSCKPGADRKGEYLPFLRNKNVALVVNHTSLLSNGTHLLDDLLEEGIAVKKILAPEHGFRGDADAGADVANGKDNKTGLPLVSIYGSTKKPTPAMLKGIDVVVFDIQDVGARFYTYISTMHYVMEACAENGKRLIILDRPNPHDYVDGPVLESKYKSFIGMHCIPVLHGLTVGELAQMINGEKWLKNGVKCDLKVVTADGWKHGDRYSLPIKPSPNLPNDQSVGLYASLCFFEGTRVSVGRGTYFPFQVIGYPDPKFGSFTFTPRPLKGFDNDPLQKGKQCYGIDLRNEPVGTGLILRYLIDFYNKSGAGAEFFNRPRHMDLLAGSDKLRLQIVAGKTEEDIRRTWKADLDNYVIKRKKYLLYQDSRY